MNEIEERRMFTVLYACEHPFFVNEVIFLALAGTTGLNSGVGINGIYEILKEINDKR